MKNLTLMKPTQTKPEKLRRVVYTPESQLRHPIRLFRLMLHDLIASRELAWRFFIRNLSAMYRQTLLGYAWAFLPPIATTLTFVFLNANKIFQVSETTIPYPAYVMVGTLLWQVFIDALNSPIKLLGSARTMLAKVNFPREALILAGVGEVVFNFLIRLILLVIVFVWYQVKLPVTAWAAPLGILMLIAMGLMIGILLAPLSVLYQDVEKGLAVFLGMWLLVTPVAYPLSTKGLVGRVAQLNPVSPLIVGTRDLLTIGTLSQPGSFLWTGGITLGLLLLGWLIYRLAMPHLIQRMTAS
jgi:lipopolysaccharide transport system permease protein